MTLVLFVTLSVYVTSSLELEHAPMSWLCPPLCSPHLVLLEWVEF